jgi:hypothetical protein
MCKANYVSTMALGSLGALGISAILSKVKGALADMPQFAYDHPYILAVSGIVASSPFGYSKLYDYEKVCDNYYAYEKAELPALRAKSLDELLKHRLLNKESSSVTLNKECDENYKQISVLNSNIMNDLSIEIRLCDNDKRTQGGVTNNAAYDLLTSRWITALSTIPTLHAIFNTLKHYCAVTAQYHALYGTTRQDQIAHITQVNKQNFEGAHKDLLIKSGLSLFIPVVTYVVQYVVACIFG